MIDYHSLSIIVLIILLVIGLAALCFGGDWLADGASGLALNLKINPVVVGLTVVSIATSMPELITALMAGARGSTELAVGNIIGSNLANTGLILGVAAIITPVMIQARLIKQEMPILLVATATFCLFGMGGLFLAGKILRWEGIILLVMAVCYLLFIVQQARRSRSKADIALASEVQSAPKSLTKCIMLVVAGSIGLALGAELLVGASVEIAIRLNVSEALIGLTIVAIGTSLPELAASIAAALRKESDIIAGNIVGSNIFNLLLIGGGLSVFFPVPVEQNLMLVEFPSLLLITVLLWLAFFTDRKVTRREGVFLVILYCLMIGLSVMVRTGGS